MRRTILGRAAGIGALAIASMLGGAQASQPLLAQANQSTEIKATNKRKINAKHKVVKEDIGGLDLMDYGNTGIPPHIYGMHHIKSSGGKKFSNRNRLSHNAKLKRRRAK